MNTTGNRKIETYLSFKISGEVFAIEVSKIKNIVEAGSLIKGQYSDKLFKGMVQLKGIQIPITDIKQKFGLQENCIASDSSIIILNIHNGKSVIPIGVITDIARELLEIKNEKLKEPSGSNTKPYEAFIIKECEINNRNIKIIDPERLFSLYEISLLQNLSEHVDC